MSENKPDGKYTVKLVYYGRANLRKDGADVNPQIGTQNIRIVSFSNASVEDIPEIAIYEMVKNVEDEPK